MTRSFSELTDRSGNPKHTNMAENCSPSVVLAQPSITRAFRYALISVVYAQAALPAEVPGSQGLS